MKDEISTKTVSDSLCVNTSLLTSFLYLTAQVVNGIITTYPYPTFYGTPYPFAFCDHIVTRIEHNTG